VFGVVPAFRTRPIEAGAPGSGDQNMGPVPRMGVSMAYDRLRKRAVIFGGRDPETRFLSDIWELAKRIPNLGTTPDRAPTSVRPASTRRGRGGAG